MEIFYKQYEIVKGAREAMLGFIDKEAGTQLLTPISAFNNSSIGYLLVHIANTYKHWSANFAMNKGLPYTDEYSISDMATIRQLFAEADILMMNFLGHFTDPGLTVTNKVRSGKMVTVTALELFTHMITHEFHHKGQVMTMCRLLGHTPPDTDAIRY